MMMMMVNPNLNLNRNQQALFHLLLYASRATRYQPVHCQMISYIGHESTTLFSVFTCKNQQLIISRPKWVDFSQ